MRNKCGCLFAPNRKCFCLFPLGARVFVRLEVKEEVLHKQEELFVLFLFFCFYPCSNADVIIYMIICVSLNALAEVSMIPFFSISNPFAVVDHPVFPLPCP